MTMTVKRLIETLQRVENQFAEVKVVDLTKHHESDIFEIKSVKGKVLIKSGVKLNERMY